MASRARTTSTIALMASVVTAGAYLWNGAPQDGVLAWSGPVQHGQLPIPANAAPPIPVYLPKPPPPPPLPPPPPVQRVAPLPPAPADPFSSPHTNWVMVPAIGINVAVGSYTDCNAGTPVPRGIAARDWCVPASTVYLLGHNPGVFSALPSLQPGALVRYWDGNGNGNGNATTYAVRSVTRMSTNDDSEIYTPGAPHLDFQTCANADGSMLWIVVAYPL